MIVLEKYSHEQMKAFLQESIMLIKIAKFSAKKHDPELHKDICKFLEDLNDEPEGVKS